MKKIIGFLIVVLLVGCGDSSTAPSVVQTAPPPTCPAFEVELEVTEVQAFVFFATKKQDIAGDWDPKLPFTAKKRGADYRQEFTFTPKDPACTPRTLGFRIPAIICLGHFMWDPTVGACVPK